MPLKRTPQVTTPKKMCYIRFTPSPSQLDFLNRYAKNFHLTTSGVLQEALTEFLIKHSRKMARRIEAEAEAQRRDQQIN